ncbi:mucin-binding protein [uncultured Limosilactobacillus sp.]|uniref:mucin-binding protein n=1 Tax=uncultured Limosilactobacillus sp. TaxID=2837629 RepID=UPI0025CFF9B8|nr:LPXTG cell wall anchor domain-containing protein [uncultured Limosilactobacillus sp.]
MQIPQGLDNADLVNPHIYYVLPTTINFDLNDFKDRYILKGSNNQDKAIPFKVRSYQSNGRTVIEYDGAGLTIPGYAAITNYINWYTLRNDLPNMSSDGYVFVSADNLQVKNTNTNPLATTDQMAMLKNAVANHTFQVGKFTVAVQSASGLGIVENAQGNTDSSLVLNGHSNDKGTTQMTLATGVIYNPEHDSTIHNIVVVANLPKDNTDTSFNFNLKQNGATVVNSITGETVPADSYEILYSTQPGKSSNEKTDLSSYVTSDQVRDWSQIKSVAVKINELSKNNGAIRLVLQGEDPTVTSDAGKIAYLASQIWSDEQLPMGVAVKTAGASSVKVDGQSTVKARLHYEDDQGHDQYIPLDDLTHQYKDNQDTMKSTDFTLSTDDQALIPAGYHLNPTPKIINGVKSWQTDAKNGTAAFGQVVKYYFDGDIVQFELSNHATAQLRYYDDTTHKFISGVEPTKAKGNINTTISFDPTTLNNLTDRYDYVGISKGNETSALDSTAFTHYQFGKYDNDDSTTQTFVVHLRHGVKPIDNQHPAPVDPQDPTKGNIVTSKTVKRTITYKFSDGSTHSTEISTNPVTQSTKFTGTGHVDKVTGKVVDVDNHGNITKTYDQPSEGIHWTATGKTTDEGTLNQQPSPSVMGYTPDKLTVEKVKVHHDTKDINEEVTYTPDQQAAQLTFYDDTAKRVIPGVVDHANGVTNGQIKFDQGDTLVKQLKDKGYEFVKVVNTTAQPPPQDLTGKQYSQVIFPNFDNDDHVDQSFVVHLEHGTKAVTDTKVVHETIHYQYADGSPVTDDYQATPIEFKRTGIEDLVTHEIVWKPWTPANGNFAEVKSPTVPGYHTTVTAVSDQPVTPDSDDLNITVTYTADPKLTTYDMKTNQDNGGQMKTSGQGMSGNMLNKTSNVAQLPQTGESQSGTLVGLGLTSLLVLFGLAKRKRHQD